MLPFASRARTTATQRKRKFKQVSLYAADHPRLPLIKPSSRAGRTFAASRGTGAHVNPLFATVLLARLEHQVERRLGRASEAGEARLSENMPQPAFASLRAQPQLDLL